jgi:hypothetical protein
MLGVKLIGRFGLKADPTGAQVAWKVGERQYLADVIGFYYREVPGAWMLKVKYFNGDLVPDVALSAVKILERG